MLKQLKNKKKTVSYKDKTSERFYDHDKHKLAEKPAVESIIKTQSKSIHCFKCDICGSTFKKEITLKKHYKTRHEEQNCQVRSKTFKISMEDISEDSENNAHIISSDTLDDEA